MEEQNNNPYASKGQSRRRKKQQGFYQNDEYEYNHNLSDNEDIIQPMQDDELEYTHHNKQQP